MSRYARQATLGVSAIVGAYSVGYFSIHRPRRLFPSQTTPLQSVKTPALDAPATQGKGKTSTFSSTGDTIFSFGPNGNYFFAVRSKDGDPPGFSFIATCWNHSLVADSLQDRVVRPYFHVWTHTGDELFGYEDKVTNRPTWQFQLHPSRESTAPSFKSLLRWLGRNVVTQEDMLKTKVIFGPGASYFAVCGNKCTYHDLPHKLESVLEEKRKQYLESNTRSDTDMEIISHHTWIPYILALGAGDTYIAIWSDGRKSTSLASIPESTELDADLWKEKRGGESLDHQWENIVLNPSNRSDHVRVKNTGLINWNFRSLSKTAMEQITALAVQYTQLRAKEDDSTYSIDNTIDGVTKTINISATSNLTAEDVSIMYGTKETPINKVRSWFSWLF